MVQTRQGTQVSKDASKDAPEDVSKTQDANNKENEPPAGAPPQQRNKVPATQKGLKRKSISDDGAASGAKPNKRKASSTRTPTKPSKKETEKKTDEAEEQTTEPSKPRLTTPDLEFDWDRSQLRDPRPTPGRVARPRYGSIDIPDDLKAQLEATREIPKPERPKGRLTNAIQDDLLKKEARMNPMKTFRCLYRCFDKGREGSPTYDEAGFQLDYDKVEDWMRPRPYNKKKMVRGMDKAVEEAQRKQKEMFSLFFQDTETDGNRMQAQNYLKDQVSKDIGVPWHQIGPEQVKTWRDKGFKPVKYEEWWTEPTAEERKRFMKMGSGSRLRKHI